MPSGELREYAETPDRYSAVTPGDSVTRFADERVCVLQGSVWASVSGVRVGAGEVGDLLEETRALVPAEKVCTWWIGPSSQPPDLVEQLVACGLREPSDGVPLLHALVLTEPPAAIPDAIEVRRVETYEDFLAAQQLRWDAFGTSEERRAAARPHSRTDYEQSARTGGPVGFLASLAGRPAATALAVPSDRGVFLIAGATAAWARGRGLYRALVRARWEYAVGRGTPALVTHADPRTSYPILRRLGFSEVCRIRRLEDVRRHQPSGSTAPPR